MYISTIYIIILVPDVVVNGIQVFVGFHLWWINQVFQLGKSKYLQTELRTQQEGVMKYNCSISWSISYGSIKQYCHS